MRSIVGVGITPPKVLGTPNPASSVMISRTLGASLGGTIRGAHQGLDCSASSLITPQNVGAGAWSGLPLMVVISAGEPRVPVTCCAFADGNPVTSRVASKGNGRTRMGEYPFRSVPRRGDSGPSVLLANPLLRRVVRTG